MSRGRFFDDTHTPKFEEKEKIPDSLFNVAAMEYKVNQEDTMACFTLESLDSMRCVYPEETVLDFDLIHKSRRYTKGRPAGRCPDGAWPGLSLTDFCPCMPSIARPNRFACA